MSSPTAGRPQPLVLTTIPAVSPTLAEAMRTCFLRAGLSKATGVSAYVLGNPRAWLGMAYHSVLENLPAIGSSDASVHLQQLWDEQIGHLKQSTGAHPLNRRYGPAESWHGYYLVLETLKLRAAELAPAAGVSRAQEGWNGEPTFREDDILALGGKLKGKPDLVRGDEIIDFKTGSIYEAANEEEAAPVLKQAYVRQLRIYAFLVHDATGKWPRRGFLYPIAGQPVEVDLDPAASTLEAEEAVNLLDRYNRALIAASDPAELASPSPDACRWCPYKTVCPAFWATADENWAGTLGGEAAAGPLKGPPLSLHGGTANAISLAVDSGTVASGEISLTPLPEAVHSSVSGLLAGERVRIVGLGRRENGTYYASVRTVILPEAEIPRILLEPALVVHPARTVTEISG